MGKRRNQPLIDTDSASNNDSGSDLDSVNDFCINHVLSSLFLFGNQYDSIFGRMNNEKNILNRNFYH